jgi:hypothetical protein
MAQTPAAMKLTTFPVPTVHTEGVAEVICTGSPESAVAVAVYVVEGPNVTLVGDVEVMVMAFTPFATVNGFEIAVKTPSVTCNVYVPTLSNSQPEKSM